MISENIKEKSEVLSEMIEILYDLTREPAVRKEDMRVFDEGIIDSFGSVQLLIEIETRFGVSVPITDFDRNEWATPALMADRVCEHLLAGKDMRS